jgi:hypothetical protein
VRREFGLRWFFAESEAAGERGFRIVIDAGDAAAGEIEHGEGIEDVIELGTGEIDVDILAAMCGAEMFEKADTVFKKDDSANGEFGWGRRGGEMWFRPRPLDFFAVAGRAI